jgi:hypothetical protein
MQMADQLRKQLETELREAADVRHLILRVYRMVSTIVISATIFITLMLVVVALSQNLPGSEERGAAEMLFLLVPALYGLWLFGIGYEYTRLSAMMENPAKHRDEMVTRLRKLLQAGGLSTEKIDEWVEKKVPKIPAPSPPALGPGDALREPGNLIS